MSHHPDVGRKIELRSRAGFVAKPDAAIEEIELFEEPHPQVGAGSIDAAIGRHVVGGGLENHRCRIHIGAAPPQPDGPAVSGRGRHALAIGTRQAAACRHRPTRRRPSLPAARSRRSRRSFVSMSNSRKTAASLPPRDRLTMVRGCSPGSMLVQPNNQSSFSAAASLSISSRTSHFGFGPRNCSSVVRRQSPRGLFASFQRL